MPDVLTASPSEAPAPPPLHPMDPRRGESLSPAFLCWLLDLEPLIRLQLRPP